MRPHHERNGVTLFLGDCREAIAGLDESSIDAIVCDPPYGIEFMREGWDRGVPGVEFWSAALRVAKPGAHLLAFGGTRTSHRLACAIEDAGFELRDTIMWVYGSGFPKSLDVGKAIDKAAGARGAWRHEEHPRRPGSRRGASIMGQTRGHGAHAANPDGLRHVYAPATDAARAWDGWGTALKPAWEPIIVARKPLVGTVAANVLEHGTGAINVDACRIPVEDDAYARNCSGDRGHAGTREKDARGATDIRAGGGRASSGRWPANVVHDGSDEVLSAFPCTRAGGDLRGDEPSASTNGVYNPFEGRGPWDAYRDAGSAARFFYCAKASAADRGHEEHDELPLFGEPAARVRNSHTTVKPVALMRWLVRLVTPPRGIVADFFMGSGTTGVAAQLEGVRFLGAELEREHIETAVRRIERARSSS